MRGKRQVSSTAVSQIAASGIQTQTPSSTDPLVTRNLQLIALCKKSPKLALESAYQALRHVGQILEEECGSKHTSLQELFEEALACVRKMLDSGLNDSGYKRAVGAYEEVLAETKSMDIAQAAYRHIFYALIEFYRGIEGEVGEPLKGTNFKVNVPSLADVFSIAGETVLWAHVYKEHPTQSFPVTAPRKEIDALADENVKATKEAEIKWQAEYIIKLIHGLDIPAFTPGKRRRLSSLAK